MKKIIFATANEGKVQEFNEILAKEDLDDIKIVSLKKENIEIDIEETGTTFKENALIKAREVCKLTNIPAIADDSGLCVKALGGEPGIYSARFMGKDTPYNIKNAAIIEKLTGVEGKDREAAFHCAIALVLPDGREFIEEGELTGFIADKPMGKEGFGYDPIVYLPEYQRTCAELTSDEKNAISHRGKALRAMLKNLKAI